jgi:adenosine kinase
MNAIACDNVVDPTGAGDALRGGLLFGLASGKTLEESLEIGQQLAWHCIQSAGAQNYTLD